MHTGNLVKLRTENKEHRQSTYNGYEMRVGGPYIFAYKNIQENAHVECARMRIGNRVIAFFGSLMFLTTIFCALVCSCFVAIVMAEYIMVAKQAIWTFEVRKKSGAAYR
jgi:hypothetical protein